MIGAVLAGGRGERFGGNKLLYRIGGKPLVAHVIEKLEMATEVDEVVIVASPENVPHMEELGVDVMVDELLVGPMGGVYTALLRGDAFVVAGDMPSIVPKLVDMIVRLFHESGKAVCVPSWPNGYIEPLHAAYSSRFRRELERNMEEGMYSLNRAIRSASVCYLPVEKLPEDWRCSFFNVNTKRDLRWW